MKKNSGSSELHSRCDTINCELYDQFWVAVFHPLETIKADFDSLDFLSHGLLKQVNLTICITLIVSSSFCKALDLHKSKYPRFVDSFALRKQQQQQMKQCNSSWYFCWRAHVFSCDATRNGVEARVQYYRNFSMTPLESLCPIYVNQHFI